jgi:hypothetical protein
MAAQAAAGSFFLGVLPDLVSDLVSGLGARSVPGALSVFGVLSDLAVLPDVALSDVALSDLAGAVRESVR